MTAAAGSVPRYGVKISILYSHISDKNSRGGKADKMGFLDRAVLICYSKSAVFVQRASPVFFIAFAHGSAGLPHAVTDGMFGRIVLE